MRREIEELKREVQRQQRIITNLTFRHLLENLPPRAPKITSSTARWTDLFSNALRSAQDHSHLGRETHPLHDVLRKYHNTTQIKNVGIGLYGTFSTNIHHFSNQFTVIDSQWNAPEADIMKALTPLPSNIVAAGIDWQKERERY